MSEWIDPALHRDFIAEQTDAIRLCTCPDGWVERFGVDVLISHKNDAALERLKTELCLWALNVDFQFRRVFARFLPKKNADRETPRLILGDAGREPAKHVAGANVALRDRFRGRIFRRDFLSINAKTAASSGPSRRGALLNCFAYTCSFSVAAATVGAKTVSIDLSKKSLARGRENFALNSLPTNDHRFLADDVMEVLPRPGAKREKSSMSSSLILRRSRGRIAGRHFRSRRISKRYFWPRWRWRSGTEKFFSRQIARACANARWKSWRAIASSGPPGRDVSSGASPGRLPPQVGAATLWLASLVARRFAPNESRLQR